MLFGSLASDFPDKSNGHQERGPRDAIFLELGAVYRPEIKKMFFEKYRRYRGYTGTKCVAEFIFMDIFAAKA